MIATTQQQSKRLLELGINPNTADMYYPHFGEGVYGDTPRIGKTSTFSGGEDIPAWSLSALLGVIKDKCGYFEFVYLKRTYDNRANPLEDVYRLSNDVYDVYNKEPINAAFEMIVWLKENNYI